jgi:Fur family peroxide stress response transcriptional regulator
VRDDPELDATHAVRCRDALQTMTPPALDPVALHEALEAAGWRCTPQRLAVYDQLARAEHHPSAEDVYQGVKSTIPSISLATVYKALEALVASGLATKITGGDGSARYDARSDRHYHLRCLRSGAVCDLPTEFDPDLITKLDPGLPERLAEQGFKVTGYRLELVGFFEGEAASGPNASAGASER